jgi:hypothetical protein
VVSALRQSATNLAKFASFGRNGTFLPFVCSRLQCQIAHGPLFSTVCGAKLVWHCGCKCWGVPTNSNPLPVTKTGKLVCVVAVGQSNWPPIVCRPITTNVSALTQCVTGSHSIVSVLTQPVSANGCSPVPSRSVWADAMTVSRFRLAACPRGARILTDAVSVCRRAGKGTRVIMRLEQLTRLSGNRLTAMLDGTPPDVVRLASSGKRNQRGIAARACGRVEKQSLASA